jgi:hypothetical protein
MIKELLCIQTHSEGIVKAGNIYPLINAKAVCDCGISYNVGIRDNRDGTICGGCGRWQPNNGWRWFAPALFVEISEQDELAQYEKETQSA